MADGNDREKAGDSQRPLLFSFSRKVYTFRARVFDVSGKDENDGGEYANTIATIPTVCRNVAYATGVVAEWATERGRQICQNPDRTRNPETGRNPQAVEKEGPSLMPRRIGTKGKSRCVVMTPAFSVSKRKGVCYVYWSVSNEMYPVEQGMPSRFP